MSAAADPAAASGVRTNPDAPGSFVLTLPSCHCLLPWCAAPHYAPRSSIQAGGGFKVPPGTNLRLPLYPIGLSQKKEA